MKTASWRRTWELLAQPSALTMLFLGFGSGLPFLLVSGTLAFWLKESGYKLDEITLLAGAGLAYSLKFLWAPAVDRLRLPLLVRFGRRRSWLLLAQCGVVVGLLAMAALRPGQLLPFVGLILFTAFAGATQDIAVDAYRVEIAPIEAQATLAATYTLGYRVALIISGAVALVMADHMTWSLVYVVMAACMAIPVAATLLSREPVDRRPSSAGWVESMREGVIEPFADFFRRYRAWIGIGLLAFVLLFKISDQALSGGLIGPFYLAAGFTKTEIGTVSKLYGVWVGIAGAFLGGFAVARWGVRRSLWAAMILGAVSNLLYVVLTHWHGNVPMFMVVISGENLSGGFLGTVAVTYLSALVNQRYTATQYALFSSLVTLPGKLLGMASGALVIGFSNAGHATMPGYATYFVFTTLAIVPALLLFAWLAPRVHLAGDAVPTPPMPPANK